MENYNYSVDYIGELRCRLVHTKSGVEIVTDAPTDNNGKGESFSPTDLVASGLAACMLTVIGIHFNKEGRALNEIPCKVRKIMASNPRRIAEVHVEFDLSQNDFTKEELNKIYDLAYGCPVANSLSSDLVVKTNLELA